MIRLATVMAVTIASGCALAQSPAGFTAGQALSSAGLNDAFAAKTDYPIMNGLAISGPGNINTQLGYSIYSPTGKVCGINNGYGCGGLLIAGELMSDPFPNGPNQVYWNDITIDSDNVVVSAAGSNLIAMHVGDIANGTSLLGGRISVWGEFKQTAISANKSHGFQSNYVGVYGSSSTTTGDGGTGTCVTFATCAWQGGYFGINAAVFNMAKDTNVSIVTAAEFDVFGIDTGSPLSPPTQAYKFGINIADAHPGYGKLWDAAIAVYSFGASPNFGPSHGWLCVLCIGEAANSGVQPLYTPGGPDGDSVIFGTHIETIASVNVAYGIDWRQVFCTQQYVNLGNKFTIDCAGNVTAAGFVSDADMILFGTPTAGQPAGRISIGGTTVQTPATCGSLAGAVGCVQIFVGGAAPGNSTAHWLPYF